MSVHQQTENYLLGYADALEFVGSIIQQTTSRGLTNESVIEMMNSIVHAIHESQGLVPDVVSFQTIDELIQYITKGGK